MISKLFNIKFILSIILIFSFLLGSSVAFAVPDGTGNEIFIAPGNVGIGTTSPQAKLSVIGGNVGIGTWTAGSALQVVGNVGIGTTAPGGALDVGGGSICLGHSCQSLWPAGGTAWILSGNNLYNTNSGNVGINTINGSNVGIGTSTPQGAFVVTNGNVGIGTWVPSNILSVGANAFGVTWNGTVSPLGGQASAELSSSILNLYNNNVSVIENSYGSPGDGIKIIGGINPSSVLIFQSSGTTGNGDSITFKFGNVGVGTTTVEMINGNVGIGSTAPGVALDVNGTVRATGFIAGAGGITLNGVNNTAWPSGGSNYWINNNSATNVGISTTYAVGIGTTFVGGTGEAAFAVMNGNVGIGTWVPGGTLDVEGTLSNAIFAGNVGIGTTVPYAGLTVGPNKALTITGGTSFPANPSNGEMFYRTDTSQLYVYANNKWQADRSTATLIVAASNSQNKEKADYICTGTNDDLVINSAINALPATGGLVFLLDGTYNVNPQTATGSGGLSAINFSSNYVALAGTGNNAVLKLINSWGSGTAYIVYAGSKNGVTVSNIKIDGNSSNQSAGTIHGVYFDTDTRSLISGMEIDNITNVGIYLTATTYSRIIGNGTNTTGSGGIHLDNSSMYNSISSNNIYNNPNGGLQVNNSSNYNTFTNNVVDTQAQESYVYNNSSYNTFTGDVFNNYTGTWSAVATNASAVGNIFSGITVSNSSRNCISIAGTNNVLTGSTITNCTYIALAAGGNGTLISDNSIQNTNRAGMWLTGGTSVVITGNSINGFAAAGNYDGIYIASASSGTIVSNNSITNGGSGYAIDITSDSTNTLVMGNYYAGAGASSIADASSSTQYLQPQRITVSANSSNTTLSVAQSGTGNIMQLLSGSNSVLTVPAGGNVGIGTWTAGSALQVVGNVGIGSTAPGGALDVGGGSICLGHNCQSSWPSGGANYWINNNSATNVGISTTYAVGIGTTFVGGTGEAAFAVMNGNVGIGTWSPSASLYVNGSIVNGVTNQSGASGPLTISANSQGGVASGYITGGGGGGGVSAGIAASGSGSLAAGAINFSSANSNITASGAGSFAIGDVFQGGGLPASITSSAPGSVAMGYITTNGSITSGGGSAYGSLAAGESSGTMTSSGGGSIALGSVAINGTMTSSSFGSIAMGDVGANGTLISSGLGSIALGYASGTNTLQATGPGSVAIGQDVQATSSNALALGSSFTNNISSSLIVGFSSTPTLVVNSTNVGIGTINPQGKLIVTGGNVGIGSVYPGEILDIQGNARITSGGINNNGLENMFLVAGTLPATPATIVNAVEFNISSAGSASQLQRAMRVDLNAGYTGSSPTQTYTAYNQVAGTSSSILGNGGNVAGLGSVLGTTTGTNEGFLGEATGGNINARR